MPKELIASFSFFALCLADFSACPGLPGCCLLPAAFSLHHNPDNFYWRPFLLEMQLRNDAIGMTRLAMCAGGRRKRAGSAMDNTTRSRTAVSGTRFSGLWAKSHKNQHKRTQHAAFICHHPVFKMAVTAVPTASASRKGQAWCLQNGLVLDLGPTRRYRFHLPMPASGRLTPSIAPPDFCQLVFPMTTGHLLHLPTPPPPPKCIDSSGHMV